MILTKETKNPTLGLRGLKKNASFLLKKGRKRNKGEFGSEAINRKPKEKSQIKGES